MYETWVCETSWMRFRHQSLKEKPLKGSGDADTPERVAGRAVAPAVGGIGHPDWTR